MLECCDGVDRPASDAVAAPSASPSESAPSTASSPNHANNWSSSPSPAVGAELWLATCAAASSVATAAALLCDDAALAAPPPPTTATYLGACAGGTTLAAGAADAAVAIAAAASSSTPAYRTWRASGSRPIQLLMAAAVSPGAAANARSMVDRSSPTIRANCSSSCASRSTSSDASAASAARAALLAADASPASSRPCEPSPATDGGAPAAASGEARLGSLESGGASGTDRSAAGCDDAAETPPLPPPPSVDATAAASDARDVETDGGVASDGVAPGVHCVVERLCPIAAATAADVLPPRAPARPSARFTCMYVASGLPGLAVPAVEAAPAGLAAPPLPAALPARRTTSSSHKLIKDSMLENVGTPPAAAAAAPTSSSASSPSPPPGPDARRDRDALAVRCACDAAAA